MRNKLTLAFLTIALGLVMITSAEAQGTMRYLSHIPFDFQARGSKLPAGDYWISSSRVGASSFLIKNAKTGQESYLGVAGPGSGDWNSNGKLVFAEIDDRWYLTEVRTATLSQSFKLPKNERDNVAKSKRDPKTLTIPTGN